MQDISPVRVGQTDPPFHAFFVDGQGNALSFPTGTVFTLYIYNPATNVTTVGTGTWSTVNANLGEFDYAWSATDSATVGNYKVFAGWVKPNGLTGFTDTADWQVQPVFYQQ